MGIQQDKVPSIGTGKRSWLKSRFNSCALRLIYGSYLLTHFLTPVVSNKERETLRELDLSPRDLSAITKSRYFITYPESPAAAVLSFTGLQYDHMKGYWDVYKYMQSKPYALYGSASHIDHQFAGHVMDDKTKHVLQTVFMPGIVVIPSKRLDKTAFFNDMCLMTPSLMKDFTGDDGIIIPGTDEDYRRIILFHELYHLEQRHTMSRCGQEYEADLKALRHYIALGGNHAVAESFINMRYVSAVLRAWAFPDDYHDHYAHALCLYGDICGKPPVSPQESARQIRAAGLALRTLLPLEKVTPGTLRQAPELSLFLQALSFFNKPLPVTPVVPVAAIAPLPPPQPAPSA